VAVRPPQ
jgi:hypothetical protein